MMLALNLPMLSATVRPPLPGGKLANVMAGLRSIRAQYAAGHRFWLWCPWSARAA